MVWAKVVACLMIGGALLVRAAPPGGEAGQGTRVFDPAKDELIAVAEPWVLWEASELVPSTRFNAAQTFTMRYYVQRFDAREGRLAFEQVSTHGALRGTVLPDGTAVLDERPGLIWAKPGEAVRRGEAGTGSPNLLALYPDGAILQTDRGGGPGRSDPFFWARRKANGPGLDLAAMKPLGRAASGSDTPRFCRDGDRIVWIDGTLETHGAEPHVLKAPALNVFDVDRGSLRTVALSGGVIGSGYFVTAFEGRHAFTGGHVIDVESGRVTETDYVQAVGLRGGLIYTMAEADGEVRLESMPIGRVGERSVVWRFDTDPGRRAAAAVWKAGRGHSLNRLVILAKDGVRVWDGAGWARRVEKDAARREGDSAC